MTTTTTETKTQRFYLRAGRDATDRSSADIEIMGISARLFINADHSAEVFKIGAKGKLGTKPIAVGSFRKHPLSGKEKMPDIQGVVQTGKGSKIAFVGWKHEDEFDAYYVIQIDDFVRQGKLVSFD